jgi:hypothetical protein
MKMKEVEKSVYRTRINRVIVSFVASLSILALLFGTLLIALFGAEPVESSESTGNFHLNLMGVVLALVLCVSVLNRIKESPFMADIYYVWRLKQLQNKIYRKLSKVKKKAELNDIDALIVLVFYYKSLKQVYQLDNNTMTLSSTEKEIEKLDNQIAKNQLTLSEDQFEEKMLESI